MARIFKTPFGAQGDTEQVPEAPQGDGSVSLTQGFGYDYEREYEDPAAKDIRREVMNGLFHDITEAVGDIQLTGIAKWSAAAAPYPAGAVVWYNNEAWTSASGNNSSVPGSGQWVERLRLATPEQAQELTAGDVAITPATLAAAFSGSNVDLTPAGGYQILPSGLIIQWGESPVVEEGTRVTFPISFPNHIIGVYCNYSAAGSRVFSYTNYDLSGFTAHLYRTEEGTPASTDGARWFAMGF